MNRPMNSYMKQYIELSNEFRKSKGSKESTHMLYDLLYELKSKSGKTTEECFILSNIYSLLGYHLSAYTIFATIADPKKPKDSSKLFAMKEKAESHADNFIQKDTRAMQKKLKQIHLSLYDFKDSPGEKLSFIIPSAKLIIFNKTVNNNDISISVPDTGIEKYLPQLNEYFLWLADAKAELIAFYNHKFDDVDEANDDWYATLEVLRAIITVNKSGNISSYIVCGDDFLQDHLLDIEITNRKIKEMTYDG